MGGAISPGVHVGDAVNPGATVRDAVERGIPGPDLGSVHRGKPGLLSLIQRPPSRGN
jgi:hypothetical protein